MNYQTEQEKFWAKDFGDEYILRNKNINSISNNLALFSKIFESCNKSIDSIIEFGANIGLNLHAIHHLLANAELSAIEINTKAANELRKHQAIWGGEIYQQSILDFKPDKLRDFVFTKGVLIHINPEMLTTVYDLLYEISNGYICVIEYYSPNPVAISYRGHSEKLFKRDFAGEILDRFKDVELIDYGFVYHRDSQFSQDDLTWFLIRKN